MFKPTESKDEALKEKVAAVGGEAPDLFRVWDLRGLGPTGVRFGVWLWGLSA